MKQVICHHFALHHPPILIMGKTIDCYHCEMQGLSGLCGLQETLYLMCQISAIVLADDIFILRELNLANIHYIVCTFYQFLPTRLLPYTATNCELSDS